MSPSLVAALLILALIPVQVNAYLNDVKQCTAVVQTTCLLASGESQRIQTTSFPRSLTSEDSAIPANCTFRIQRSSGTNGMIYFIFTNGFAAGIKDRPHTSGVKSEFFVFPHSSAAALEAPLTSGFRRQGMSQKLAVEDTSTNGSTYNSNKQIHILRANATALDVYFGAQSWRQPWTALQAFAYAEDPKVKTNCLMTGQTFNLSDSTANIPVYGVLNDYPSNEACVWTFNIPPDFQLKLEAISYELTPQESVKVLDAKGNLLKAVTGAGLTYLNGTSFTIQYNKQVHLEANSSLIGFGALVSIVPTVPPISQYKCQHTVNNDVVTFGNFDPDSGYAFNSQCNRTVSAKQDNEINLWLDQSFFERPADALHVKTQTFDYAMRMDDNVNVQRGEDVSVYFQSDSSINQAGFTIVASYVPCQCPQKVVIPCNAAYTHTLSYSGAYCSDFTCSYSFAMDSKCPKSTLQIEAFGSLKPNSADTYTVKADGKVVISMASPNQGQQLNASLAAGVKLEAQLVSSKADKVGTAPFMAITFTSKTVGSAMQMTLSWLAMAASVLILKFK